MHFASLVGNTPLVRLEGFDTGPCELYLKLESQNPGGSIKDRVALSMIEDAERKGALKPGGTIVEATAGNTGLGLSLIGAQKGYRCVMVIPDKMSRDKLLHIQALGAEVVLTRSDVVKGHPDYYQDKARAIADAIPNAWYADQFSNPANPLTHERTTGPEIWEQMNHELDAIVVGVGSGGTLGGLTNFFARTQPNVSMVIADPEGSVIAPFIKTGRVPKECGSWLVEGIGEDFLPSNANFFMVKDAYTVSDKDSFITAREVLRKNGLLIGSSSGTLITAAIRYCQNQTKPKRVVTFVCDGGGKYLSKMFNSYWMVDQGFLPVETHGDLRDLIARPFNDGAMVSVGPNDKLNTAYIRMKQNDVSQLPVVENGSIEGILDESDLLLALSKDRAALQRSVKHFMSTKLKVLKPGDSIGQVESILKKDLVAIIAEKQKLYGFITKIDLVDFLRRSN